MHGHHACTCTLIHTRTHPRTATTTLCRRRYCVFCILKWALLKGAGANPPWCPQCKAPFSYLYVHRQLDGDVTDVPMEESVCLLKCATWFTEHLRVSVFFFFLGLTHCGAAPRPGASTLHCLCSPTCPCARLDGAQEADKGKLLSAHDADDDEETLIDDDLYDYDDMLDGAPGGETCWGLQVLASSASPHCPAVHASVVP